MRIQELAGGEWSKFDAQAAFRCTPSVAIPIIAGVASGHPRPCVMIAAGAFSVGFGSFQELHNSRLLPMVLAALGMCLSSWVGTITGASNILSVLACTGAAFIYANAFRFGKAASWIALQCAIWLVISTAYPAQGLKALNRGSMILLGGLLQIVVVATWWHILHRREAKTGPRQKDKQKQKQAGTAPSPISWNSFVFRASVTIGISAALYRWLSAQNGYWIPVTSLIVIRPDLSETAQRALGRGIGTIAGLAIAGVIVAAGSHSPWLLAAGVPVFAWGGYALFQVSYAYFAASLTAYVVFLLSLAGIREEELIVHRVLFTICGVALALSAHWIAAWAQGRSAALPGRSVLHN